MTDLVPDHKLTTAEEMFWAIEHIMIERRGDASRSQYDVEVCVRSVEAAREVFEAVPVEGTAGDYGRAVDAALDTLRENYWDSDGEFTSKGMVGDVGGDVYHLLETQKSTDLVDIDRKEARECLIEEITNLARLAPRPLGGAVEASTKAEFKGPSGFDYFVAMVFERITDERFVVIGKIYSNDSYRFPVLEERLELDDRDDN